nr:hypothetical protein [Candidatus Sigynarchaeota archaeon]
MSACNIEVEVVEGKFTRENYLANAGVLPVGSHPAISCPALFVLGPGTRARLDIPWTLDYLRLA